MIVEVYSSDSEDSITVVVKDDSQNSKILAEDSVLMYEIEEESWSECMTEHYKRMGWGAYIPF